jgi:hypothetical protein
LGDGCKLRLGLGELIRHCHRLVEEKSRLIG